MSNSLASRIVIERDLQTPIEGQDFDYSWLPPFRLKAGLSRQDASECLQGLDTACAPASKTQTAHEVATLMARTKTRALGDGEARFMAETMVADLSKYPPDVVHFACEYWIDGGAAATFFPSWPELKEICDKRMDGRLRLRRALVHALSELA